ncbi:DUF2802 domain-containing protein [Agaribacter flavus]|uniref:DUF2802 domain-containing protein n=1 Tax=Agaribacter flavus TaxID=1902781 RepID=A0ABV7FPJ0_9ALTE
MNDFIWLIVFSSITLLLLVISLVTFVYARNTRAKLLQGVGLIDNLHKLQQQTDKKVLAQAEDIASLEQSLNEVKDTLFTATEALSVSQIKLETYEEKLALLADKDPELKMYSKANKLVAAGESIDDVMEASGLPRAEVEVLFSLQRRNL